jgi:anti-sigma regulatory factor (Ser/Thr protein kinase)
LKKPEPLTFDSRPVSRLGWRTAWFYVAWTAFAVVAVWWLATRGSAATSGAPLVIDHGNTSHASIGEQIRVWLKLADLNLRGAYSWVLLAPYVLLLAAIFPLETGRLRLSLPVHLAAFVIFAAASSWLQACANSGAIGLVVVSNHIEGAPFPWPFPSNGPPFQFDGGSPNRMTNVQIYNLHPGNLATTTTVRSPDGEERIVVTTTTNQLPGSQHPLTAGHLTAEELVETETNSGTGRRMISKRITTWPADWQDGRKQFSLLLDLIAYGTLIGGAHAVHFYRRFREREQRALLLESHLASARLHALQAQLHPHFLFNALNAVATLIHQNADAALETLTSFSELLRLALNQSGKQEVPLREELQFLERYMEIQQVRLGDRLRFQKEVEGATLDCLVPALVLQLLAENAIRHGIEPASQPGTVRLSVRRNGGHLLLGMEDNGAGLAATADFDSGIGLSNLRARLRLLYGDDQKLEIDARREGGVTVQIKIPAHEEPANLKAEPAVRP